MERRHKELDNIACPYDKEIYHIFGGLQQCLDRDEKEEFVLNTLYLNSPLRFRAATRPLTIDQDRLSNLIFMAAFETQPKQGPLPLSSEILDSKLAEFDNVPLFMKTLPDDVTDDPALSALQNLAYEGTPDGAGVCHLTSRLFCLS